MVPTYGIIRPQYRFPSHLCHTVSAITGDAAIVARDRNTEESRDGAAGQTEEGPSFRLSVWPGIFAETSGIRSWSLWTRSPTGLTGISRRCWQTTPTHQASWPASPRSPPLVRNPFSLLILPLRRVETVEMGTGGGITWTLCASNGATAVAVPAPVGLCSGG